MKIVRNEDFSAHEQFYSTQTCSFISVSSMADFALSGSYIAAMQTVRPTKPKILTV